MSRRQSRDPLERLDTPAWMTRALLAHLPALVGWHVLEPCAGANAITDVLRAEADCQVAAFDVAPRADGITAADTLTPGFFEQIPDPGAVAVVTNTPFSLAAAYWRRTQHVALVALLVRITWLEATKDREDVRDPDAVIILPRGRFTGPGAIDPETGKPYKGGDSATVAWALWSPLEELLPARPIIRVNRREKAQLERAALSRPQRLFA